MILNGTGAHESRRIVTPGGYHGNGNRTWTMDRRFSAAVSDGATVFIQARRMLFFLLGLFFARCGYGKWTSSLAVKSVRSAFDDGRCGVISQPRMPQIPIYCFFQH